MYCEEKHQLTIYNNQHIHLLQQWIEDLTDDEKEIYFDCTEEFDDNNQFIEIFPIYHQPWISEIWLSVHRKTNIFHRFFNCFNQSKRLPLTNLAEEFIRIYKGQFNYSIGFRFYISYNKEKWLLILKRIIYFNHPIYPYPQTRIIFIRNDLSFIAR